MLIGAIQAMGNEQWLQYVRARAETAQLVASVGTAPDSGVRGPTESVSRSTSS